MDKKKLIERWITIDVSRFDEKVKLRDENNGGQLCCRIYKRHDGTFKANMIEKDGDLTVKQVWFEHPDGTIDDVIK